MGHPHIVCNALSAREGERESGQRGSEGEREGREGGRERDVRAERVCNRRESAQTMCKIRPICVTSSYILCHIIIHTMSHHHTFLARFTQYVH